MFSPRKKSPRRPGVAIALGSGSARGLAHIGILRVLGEAGVPIRGVAGTSIGAVVGGLYVAGALDRYEEVMRGLDRQGVLWFLDPVLPLSGFFGGRRLEKLMSSLVGRRAIEDLPFDYCAVACALESGNEVRLCHGDLVSAMRASFAIPGVFTPSRVGGRWLIDGGAASPVPIGAARAQGFEHLIAVDLHESSFRRRGVEIGACADPDPPAPSPVDPDAETATTEPEEAPRPLPHLAPDPDAIARTREYLQQTAGVLGESARRLVGRANKFWKRFADRREHRPSLADVIGDSMSFAQLSISRQELAADPPDLLLTPCLPEVGVFDFHRATELIEEGERVAREALERGQLDPFLE